MSVEHEIHEARSMRERAEAVRQKRRELLIHIKDALQVRYQLLEECDRLRRETLDYSANGRLNAADPTKREIGTSERPRAERLNKNRKDKEA